MPGFAAGHVFSSISRVNVTMKIANLPKSPAGVLALNPLVFTGINDTPENPRLGLGYHQLYDFTQPVSLIAKLPDVTRVGDTIALYWDDAQVQTYHLDQPTIDKGWLSFNVSPALIGPPSGTTYYTLYDNEADDLQCSEPRTINVNRRPPGGLDPDPETAINDNLQPATIAPTRITDAAIQVTVTVPPWTYMEEGDELTILWNGIRVDHPKLVDSDLDRPVVVVIPRETLELGGSNARLPVAYEIRDIVDNYSLVSLNAFADVDIDPAAVNAPRVVEANQQTLVLDLAALGDKDAHVQIPRYAGAAPNDSVTLLWVGRDANSDIPLILPPQTVTDPDFDPMPVFAIPNAHMKLIAGGAATARYEVTEASGATRRSKSAAITVTGLPIPLAAPQVQQATGDVIDLEQLTGDSVSVVIAAYTGKKAGDRITLVWTGEPQDGPPSNYTDTYTVKAGEELLDYTFIVDRINIDPLVGGQLTLNYQVLFTGATSPVDSLVNKYQVTGATAIIEDFATHTGALITAGQSVTTQYTTIQFVSGNGRAGFPAKDSGPGSEAPSMVPPILHVCYQNPVVGPGTQIILIDLRRGCIRVECDVFGSLGGTSIDFLDAAQAVIQHQTVPVQRYQHLTFNSPNRRIQFLQITGDQDWTYWDNIKMIV